MSDLIKREDAIKKIRNLPNAGIRWFVNAEAVFKVLLELPAVEPKIGKWIKNEHGLKCCSICGERPLEVCYYDINFHGYMGKEILSNYCPYCGAKMEMDYWERSE